MLYSNCQKENISKQSAPAAMHTDTPPALPNNLVTESLSLLDPTQRGCALPKKERI